MIQRNKLHIKRAKSKTNKIKTGVAKFRQLKHGLNKLHERQKKIENKFNY